jgi:hypothetical protein
MEASAQLKHVELSLIEVSGANPRKDLEAELLNNVIMDLTEYGSVEDLIKTAKTLPFKVELPEMPKLEPKEKIEIKEDMDPALKEAIEEQGGKKKVQEKRKKKGA